MVGYEVQDEAKAMFAERIAQPLETGFSIYRKNFIKSWSFTTSLADIGHYYGQYARLMEHWQRVFGDGLASVRR